MGHATQDVYVQDLIQRLGIHPDTVTKSGISRVGVISREEAVSFLSKRLEVKGHRTQAQVDAAILFLKELGVEANEAATEKNSKPNEANVKRPTPPRKTVPHPAEIEKPSVIKETKQLSSFARVVLSEDFLSAVVMVGVVAQIYHTIQFVLLATVGTGEASAVSLAASIAIGLAIDMTAFMVSIRTRNEMFLQIALAAHILINCVFYYIHNAGEASLSTWIAQGILSVAIALANFSYSELFLSSISKNNSK